MFRFCEFSILNVLRAHANVKGLVASSNQIATFPQLKVTLLAQGCHLLLLLV